jgi:hypothetical protein
MTLPMAYQQDEYAHAVSVPSLGLDRQARLVAHILCRNQSLTSQPAVSLGVARSAAALLAADPDRLSGPTALAQAEALAQATQFGPALMQIQSSLMVLAAVSGPGAAVDGLHAAAMGRILWNLIDEASSLLDRLGTQSNWRWSADK